VLVNQFSRAQPGWGTSLFSWYRYSFTSLQ